MSAFATEAATDHEELLRDVRFGAGLARWAASKKVRALPALHHAVKVADGRVITTKDAMLEENIAYVKSEVSCLDLASEETDLRQVGGVWRGACPVHGGENPTSFCLIPSGEGRYDSWWCHSCGVGGDVIDLAGHVIDHAGGPGRPLWAMQALAERFGLTLMRERDFYTERQIAVRKARRRAQKAFETGSVKHFFEAEVAPLVNRVEDEDERLKLMDLCLREAGL